MLFDSHAHLHDPKFHEDREDALARAIEAGVGAVLTLGTTPRTCRDAIALAEAHGEVLAAAGIHPSHAECWEGDTPAVIESLLAHARVPVLGEIGLDYYWKKDAETLAQQHLAFREQLRLARRLGKPVSIHSRDSNDDVIEVLREEHGPEIGGVLHCFIGTEAQMRAGIAVGFAIGVGGAATYPKSGDLRAALLAVGIEHLVLETDAPYLPPQPRRGRRNEPAFVAHTADAMAELFGLTRAEVEAITWANALRALRIGPDLLPKENTHHA